MTETKSINQADINIKKADIVVPLPASAIEPPAQPSVAPKTTLQEDITLQGQRRINLIWENTQSWIALLVVFGGFFVNAAIVWAVVFLNKDLTVNQLALITVSLQFINLTVGIVIGFYFSRTNHSAIGGVGFKASSEEEYKGR